MTQGELDARSRFLVINAVRIAGVAMVLIGILIVQGVIESIDIAGYVLIGVGLVDVFVMPQVFARKWRTPPGSGPDAGIE